jgi:hypothetical protein
LWYSEENLAQEKEHNKNTMPPKTVTASSSPSPYPQEASQLWSNLYSDYEALLLSRQN